MKFMILIHSDERADAKVTQEEQQKVFAAYGKYTEDLKKAGVMLAGDALQPSKEGARVRVTGGKRSVVDGPFTETKEVCGGYYLIDVKSREQAIEWGARCPGAEHGTIEVRAVMNFDM